jgi:hypothetical protein
MFDLVHLLVTYAEQKSDTIFVCNKKSTHIHISSYLGLNRTLEYCENLLSTLRFSSCSKFQQFPTIDTREVYDLQTYY